MLTRDAILQAQKLKTETVPAPGWGGDVIISEISAPDRLTLFRDYQSLAGSEQEKDLAAMAMLVVRCIVDGEGKRIFSDDDASLLMAKNLDTLRQVFAAASALNGIGGAKEDIEGNSEPSPGDSSPST